MAQFHAGYFLENILQLIPTQNQKSRAKRLLHKLSVFDAQLPESENIITDLTTSAALLSNMLSRGLPTRPSEFIEDEINETFSCGTKTITYQNKLQYPALNISKDIIELIYKALHIIDPRITKQNQIAEKKNWNNLPSVFEENFIFEILPAYIGECFIQLFEPQRSYASILKNSCKFDEEYRIYNSKFLPLQSTNDAIDFSLDLPYGENFFKGITIELENDDYDTISQKELKQLKDKVAEKSGWAPPLRIRTKDLHQILDLIKPLRTYISNEYFDTLAENFEKPLYNDKKGLRAMELALSPIAIARVQKILLKLIENGNLKPEAKKWQIAVIERDVPCATLAVEDLKQQFEMLFALQGRNMKLPEIELHIFSTKEFKRAKLKDNVKAFEQFNSKTIYDVLIDISVLQRRHLKNEPLEHSAKHFVTIRSILSIESERKFSYYAPITYKIEDNNKAFKAINFFARNILRQFNFNKKQLEMAQLALQQQNMLGVSSSVEEKAQVFLVTALLQAGIAVSVQPLRSTIADYGWYLHRNFIDAFVKQGISEKLEDENIEILQKIEAGETLLAFLLPQNIRSVWFQNLVTKAAENGVSFSYLAIFEAHCASESNYDFRPVYYQIGKPLSNIFPNSLKPITSLAFSILVSFETANDVAKQLDISENAIIISENEFSHFDFNIENVQTQEVHPNIGWLQANDFVGRKKQTIISNRLKKWFNNFKNKSGNKYTVVFCPFVQGVSGITDSRTDGLSDKLYFTLKTLKVSSCPGTQITHDYKAYTPDVRDSIDQQKAFLQNRNEILIGTNSYTIGTQKANIGQVIYTNIPSSPTELVQTISCAGVDLKPVIATVYTNNQPVKVAAKDETIAANGESELKTSIKTITIERQIQNEILRRKFKGYNKEIAIIRMLLNKITFHSHQNDIIILDRIEKEFGAKFQFAYYPANYPFELKVTSGNLIYGSIDLREGLKVDINNSNVKKVDSEKVLIFIREKIMKYCPQPIKPQKWLLAKSSKVPEAGIIEVLNTLEDGKGTNITLHFQNDRYEQIATLLVEKVSELFSPEIIRSAYETASNEDEFLKELNKTAELPMGNLPPELRTFYLETRDRTDTVLALYRLAVVGVIDDYTIDFNSETISVKILKKPFENYLTNLYKYMQLFVNNGAAAAVFQQVAKFKGETIIHKILNFSIAFSYQNTIAKRYEEIENMETFCKAVADKNDSFANLATNFHKAKYLTSASSYNIVEDLNKKQTFNYEIVDNYLKLAAKSKDNLLHLKNSTEELIHKKNDKPEVLLINSFVTLAKNNIPKEKQLEAVDRMANGLAGIHTSEETEKDNTHVQDILTNLYAAKPQLKEEIDSYLKLKMHVEWITKFNKRFLAV